MDNRKRTGGIVLVAGLAWLAAAVLAGATGTVARLRPPAPQLVLAGLTIALLVLYAAVPALRSWFLGLDPRRIVALHLTRFVGVYFLVLHGRGELPWAFAVPGGWGDIVVAALALVLVVAVSPATGGGRTVYLAWDAVVTGQSTELLPPGAGRCPSGGDSPRIAASRAVA